MENLPRPSHRSEYLYALSEFQRVIDSLRQTIMGKKTLMALALTCKSFSGPALDLLWRDLPEFEPLIKCLPQSLWKQDGKNLEFQRTMTPDDWSIFFCKYNYRVRSLVNHCHAPYMRQMLCSTLKFGMPSAVSPSLFPCFPT
ncbi:hypothetical protein BDR04DRAFT_682074 [Suillus decipiens]|nr:hypothetical protein BDR04DRAFT_682074 [Suillus decipiens]